MNLKWFVLPALAAVSVASGSWAKSTQEQAPARSQDMGRIVIVGYKPKPGKAEALRSLARSHIQRLRVEGLVTPGEAIIMEVNDGTIIEVFEWKSKEAIESAHKNPAVQAHPSQKQNSYLRNFRRYHETRNEGSPYACRDTAPRLHQQV
jgi:quinol monooxygenase YgiN